MSAVTLSDVEENSVAERNVFQFPHPPQAPFSVGCFGRLALGYVPIYLHLICDTICHHHEQMVCISSALKSRTREREGERNKLILTPKFFIIMKHWLITYWTRGFAE